MSTVTESDREPLAFASRADAVRHIENRACDVWDRLIDPNFPAPRFPGLDWAGDEASLWSEAPKIDHTWRISDLEAEHVEARARLANQGVFGLWSCSSKSSP